ncbi:MAG: FHA domain-containing protein [Clostridia bacterium]|nr:FHA domain-containing protein [Clostridia bacterium]
MEFITSVSRYILPIVTVILLTKCIMTLLLGHPKEKIYGYIIDMKTGEKYALNMWETSIGRSGSCDIVITYNTVSRSHAVISRRIDGWYVYDLNSKSGIKVNGVVCEKKSTINNGDIISLSNIPFRFEIIDDPVQRVGKKKKQRENSKTAQAPAPAPMPHASAPHNNVNMPHRAQETDFISDQDFYDEYNKPKLNIRPHEGSSVPISQDVYSGKASYTIDTPDHAVKQRTAFQPRLINKDSGEIFILCGNEVTIGSGMKNDIRLRSREVSRVHAILVLYEDGWAIENASPNSGTFLNSHAVTSPQLLFDGDVIALGDERLYYKTNR